MLTKVDSIAYQGIDPIKIEVEVNLSKKGLPGFYIIGLGDKAVSESKDRVYTALRNTLAHLPTYKITVNLAPADVKKEGSFYDLPISVALLSKLSDFELPEKSLFFGELSLGGDLRHTKGALLAALFTKEIGYKKLYLPEESANEASVVSGIQVYPIKSLGQLIGHFSGNKLIEPLEKSSNEASKELPFVNNDEIDIKHVLGQELAKRALTIAAAGGHNLFFVGPPGSGKSMLAKSISSLLPQLNEEESIEVTKIYSAIGRIAAGQGLITKRVFRSPHHTTSYAGLIGGGSYPQPGEISLAHRGVLFLDEFPEFNRTVLEALRQPIEDGKVTISRSNQRITFPADFMLLASANPCQCGYLGSEDKECVCTQNQITAYKKRLSGPILDRIDMHVDVKPVDLKKLTQHYRINPTGESSAKIRRRLTKVRLIQAERFEKYQIHSNSQMNNNLIGKYCKMEEEAEKLLNDATVKFQLSARGYFRLLKVARTIADLESLELDEVPNQLELHHISEALQFRLKDNNVG